MLTNVNIEPDYINKMITSNVKTTMLTQLLTTRNNAMPRDNSSFLLTLMHTGYFYALVVVRVSNDLDPDQDLRYIGPGLGPNCLQRI